jgi:hypothetical protein
MSKAIQPQDLAVVAAERAVQGVRPGEQDRGEVGASLLWKRFVQTEGFCQN